MDDIRGMLDRLPELSDAELSDLEDQIVQAFGSVESQEISRESVAEMTFLADSVESVRAEMAARENELSELATQASEAAARVSEAAADGSDEVEDSDSDSEVEPPEEFAASPVTAASDEPVVAEKPAAKPVAKPEVVVADAAAAPITAAAGDPILDLDGNPVLDINGNPVFDDGAGNPVDADGNPAEIALSVGDVVEAGAEAGPVGDVLIDQAVDAAVDDAVGAALDEVIAEEFPEGVPGEEPVAEEPLPEEDEEPEEGPVFAADGSEKPVEAKAAEAAVVEPVAAEAAVVEVAEPVAEVAAEAAAAPAPETVAPAAAEAAVVEPVVAEAAVPVATEAAVAEVAEPVVEVASEAAVVEPVAAEAAVVEPVVEAVEAAEAAVVEAEAIVEAEAAVVVEEPVLAAREDAVDSTESVEAQMGDTVGPATFSAPADRLPGVRESVEAMPISLIAGGDIPGITAGSALEGASGLANAMSLRLHTLRRASGGRGDQVVVASLIASFPEARTLRGNELDSNTDKIKAVTKPEVIVASGGFCAPLPVNYDIFDIGGSTDTPLKDSLPTFNADRGGVRYIVPPVLGDYSGAIGIWTEEDDAAAIYPPVPPGPPTTPTKPCLHVQCAGEEEEYLDAITVCLCFGNLQTRAFPELIDMHNQLALVEAARFTELYILNEIKSKSTIVSIPAVLGTARDVLISVERAATAYRHQYRLDPELPLRFVAPQWLHAMIRSDLTAQLPGDGMETTFNVSNATIDGFFKERNINPVWTLEGIGDQPTVTDYPDHVEWALFSEGTFTLLDGGSLDIGLVRDMELVSTNDYCMFTESFMSVAKTGLASLWVGEFLNVNGGSAGTLDVAAVDY